MPDITRSPGTIVNSGGAVFIVGGGYQGLTDELDSVVTRAAELLHQTFDQEVEIRFNSDRRSGGAWLVTPQRSDFWRNGEVGLNAGLYLVDHPEVGKWLDLSYAEREAWPRKLVISTLIKEAVMCDPSKLWCPYGPGPDRSDEHVHASLEAAISYLIAEVDRPKLNTTQPRAL